MTKQEIEYQVDEAGAVISLVTVEGKKYKVKSEPAPDFVPTGGGGERWHAFKVAVIKQPLGIWMQYTGWLSKTELKRAQSALSRKNKDKFWVDNLDNKDVLFRTDLDNLRLFVKVIEM